MEPSPESQASELAAGESRERRAANGGGGGLDLDAPWLAGGVHGLVVGLILAVALPTRFGPVAAVLAAVGITVAQAYQQERKRTRALLDVLEETALTLEEGGDPDLDPQGLPEPISEGLRRVIGAAVAGFQLGRHLIDEVCDRLGELASEAEAVEREIGHAVSQVHSGRDSLDLAMRQAGDLARSARGIAASASEVKEAVGLASGTCREGVLGVKDAVAGMDRIRTQVHEIAERMDKLEAATARIDQVVKLIQDISRQTDLLALNAAIEAAGAGAAGDRFGVVAVEVKRLAQRTTEATGSIKELVREIRDETRAATEATQKGTAIAAEGEGLVRRVGEALQQMFQEVARSAKAAAGISEAVVAEVAMVEAMSSALGRVTAAIDQGDDAAGRAAEAARSLTGRSHRLAEDARRRRLRGG